MNMRKINDHVSWLGVVDWNRRLFDSLIPLPDGTSYNAYLVRGETRTVLLDTADSEKSDTLMAQLASVKQLDYVVAHHVEQDHSGSLPRVLAKYPAAVVLASAKAKGMLIDHLHLDASRIRVVEDGETVDIGGRTLEFVYTPWVHWPETMCTFLREDGILFSCDFFGSHLATTDLFVTDRAISYEAAKRYFAEIMMPFRPAIRKNLARVDALGARLIAPSHGPMYDDPSFILDAYRDWVSDTTRNEVVLPYISMHGSTQMLVDRLVASLADRGVRTHLFDLSVTDIGKLAIALVDATTLVVGTPTVHVGPHPVVAYTAMLANSIRPKLRYASVLNSHGWSSKAVEQIVGMISNLKVEVIEPVVCRGCPTTETLAAVDAMADTIAAKHAAL